MITNLLVFFSLMTPLHHISSNDLILIRTQFHAIKSKYGFYLLFFICNVQLFNRLSIPTNVIKKWKQKIIQTLQFYFLCYKWYLALFQTSIKMWNVCKNLGLFWPLEKVLFYFLTNLRFNQKNCEIFCS